MDFDHPLVLISGADVAHEVARQLIMVMMSLEEIVEAEVVSIFNEIAQKRDEMSCAYFFLIIYIGLTTHNTYF